MIKRKTIHGRLFALLLVAAMAVQLFAMPAFAVTTTQASDAVRQSVEALEPLYDPEDIVTVVVQLTDDPLLSYETDVYSYDQGLTLTAKGEALLEDLEARQNRIISAIETQILKDEADVRYSYSLVTNAVAMDIPFGRMEEISQLPGVECVYVAPVVTVDPLMDGAAEMEEAIVAWEDYGYHGEGMVIAVLDTGIDTDHPLFADAPDDPRLTAADVLNLRMGMNATKAAYLSEKIPFAYNYVTKSSYVDHSGGSDHGTHVAGICAGNTGVSEQVCGIAPEAQLAVFKVLSDEGTGSTADIMAAVEDAVVLGVDVINMSLGSTGGFTYYGDTIPGYDEVYANVEKAGIFLAVSAGNSYDVAFMNKWGYDLALTSNPDTGIIGAPGTVLPSTTVASVNNTFERGLVIQINGTNYIYNDTATEGEPSFTALPIDTYTYVMIGGVGKPEDFEGLDLSGKIAVISRGETTFSEKVQNAADAGAVAAIIYNNTAGIFGMAVENRAIPAISVSQYCGNRLAEAAVDGVGSLRTVEGVTAAESEGAWQMSDFSSWGATSDLRLEPDITAVGGNVYSSVDNGGYASNSGTSMAAPNLAGCATLLRQAMKEQTDAFGGIGAYNFNLISNAILMSTARPLSDPNGLLYSPRKQGAGFVQMGDALATTAYLTVEGMNRPKIELGDDPGKTGCYDLVFSIHNFGDVSVTYELDARVLTESVFHSEELGLDFIAGQAYDLTDLTQIHYRTGKTVKVPANSSVTVSVALELTQAAKDYMDGNFENGIFVEGFVFLAPTDDAQPTLSLPYMGFYGDWSAVPALDLGTYGDGVDSISSQYENTAMCAVNYLQDGTMTTNSYFPLGFNPYWDMQDSENPDGVPFYAGRSSITNQAAVNNYAQQGAFVLTGLYVSMLRNARNVSFTIQNAVSGELYWQVNEPMVSKSYYVPAAGIIYPLVETVMWYGTDAAGELLPNNTQAELVVSAQVDYGTGRASDQSWTIPITIDNETPQIVDAVTFEENDRTMLRLSVTDNQYLAYVQVSNEETILCELPVGEYTPGVVTTVTVDVTGRDRVQILLGDYAYNELTEQIEIPKAGNDLVLSPETVTLMPGEELILKVFNLSDDTVAFSTENAAVATVDQAGVVTAVAPGETRIYATAGNSVAWCDVTVSPPAHEHVLTEMERHYAGNHTTVITYTCPCGYNETDYIAADCPSAAFEDVPLGEWYHDYVDCAVERGLMQGMSDTKFAPGGELTRAMMVTTLYRLAGEPQVELTDKFSDVADDQWYSKAVSWAAENNIVVGMTETTFEPGRDITREQAATILYRYVTEYLELEPAQGADLSQFSDSAAVSDYAANAMAWAVAEGLFEGFPNGSLQPKTTLTRAQMAKLLTILAEKF